MALVMQSDSSSGAWQPAFFSFLPMCFFFVGANTSAMQREIQELRKQVTDLQEKGAG
jgi:hypothetical protein